MYILIGLIIIIIIVLLYFFAFPGIFLLRSNNISGYWTDIFGNIYYIESTGNNTFKIIHKNIIYKGYLSGTLFTNYIYFNGHVGNYKLQLNSIKFNDKFELYKT